MTDSPARVTHRAMRWYRLARGLPRRLRTAIAVASLRRRSGRGSLTGDADAIVSLTTYGPRLGKVHLAVESIGRGHVRPRRLILWIDDPVLRERLTPELRDLVSRGLEIRACDDLGPHKKYQPALDLVERDGVSHLVTADDDTIYPRWWLKELLAVASAAPGTVACCRAREVQIDDAGFAPWAAWPLVRNTNPSLAHFAIGDGGVAYPRPVLRELSRRGRGFQEVAPRADDVWLHAAAVSVGAPTRQVRRRPVYHVAIPGSQEHALSRENVAGGANDVQIAATYSPVERAALMRARERDAQQVRGRRLWR